MTAPAGTPGSGPAAPARVLVVSGSVGAGHDGAASELAARLRAAGVEVDVRDFLTALPGWAAWVLGGGYAASLARFPVLFGLLFARAQHRGAVWRSMRWIADRGGPCVARWVATGGYAVVVSTYPISTQCLGSLRARGACAVPVVTYVTDPAAHVAWVHPAVDRHLTVTDATARQGERDHELPFTAAGPLVARRFAEPVPAGAVEELARELGLTGDRPVALLVGGSLGLGDLHRAVADVAAAGVRPVVLCGRNEDLRRRIAAVPGAVPLGWRDDVHLLLHVVDVLVHNAGGMSFTEALVSGVPAVTYREITGHGRANARLLDSAGLSPWVRRRSELGPALRRAVARGRRPVPWPDPTGLVLELALPARQPRDERTMTA